MNVQESSSSNPLFSVCSDDLIVGNIDLGIGDVWFKPAFCYIYVGGEYRGRNIVFDDMWYFPCTGTIYTGVYALCIEY